MAVQNRLDNTTEPIILSENSLVKNGTVMDLNAQRTGPLLRGTILAKVVGGDELWTPWVAVNGVDGSAVPRGIYLGGDITLAEFSAAEGMIEDCPILVGDATVNEQLIVCDQDILTLEDIIGLGTIWAVSGRLALKSAANIYIEETVSISGHEN
jgi:hypothetical protein